MSDVAELGLAVDSGPVKDATGDLKEFSKASKEAAKSADDLGKASGQTSKGADAVQKSAEKAGAALKEAEAKIKATTNAYEKMKTAMSGGGGAGGIGGGGLAGEAAGFSARSIAAMAALGAGITAAGVAIGYLVYQYSEAQQKIEQSLIGIGKRTGETVAGINRFSVEQSSAVGLSVDQARDVAIQFARTGSVAASSLKGLGDAVYGFSILTGKDATESAKTLAQALSGDLVKGAKDLDKIYGDLDASTLENIASLQMQGDRTKAAQLIIDGLAGSNKKARESVDLLTQGYNLLANALSRVKNLPADLSKNPGAMEFLSVSGSGDAGGSDPVAETQRRLREETEKLDAEAYVQKMKRISLANLEVVQSTFPQIEQLQKVQTELNKLEEARNSGAALGETGSIYNDAATTALQNQKAAIQESFGVALRYNEAVAQISISWGNVGQSVALQLQSMQNALPVAEAWTTAARMRAQEEATYLTLIQQGRTEEEASAVAAKQYELAKAGAVANAERLVQVSNDNLDKIRAQGTGMEGVVASSIAYRDAINSGATATQAAAIAANTLASSMEQAARAASNSAQAAAQAAEDERFNLTNGQVTSDTFRRAEEKAKAESKANQHVSTSPLGFALIKMQKIAALSNDAKTLSQSIDASITTSVDAALSVAKGTKAGAQELYKIFINGVTTDLVPFSTFGLSDVVTKQAVSQSDLISQVSTLYQLKNAETDDKTIQRANLREEMAWLQTQPQTLEVRREMVNLTQQLKSLTDATDANTNALNNVTLNPLYNGRGALRVGYYKAASGFDGMVTGGIPGVDSVPINILAQKGERVRVDPVGAQDNSRGALNITQNFDFRGSGGRDHRMSELQLAQGFGRVASAVSGRR